MQVLAPFSLFWLFSCRYCPAHENKRDQFVPDLLEVFSGAVVRISDLRSADSSSITGGRISNSDFSYFLPFLKQINFVSLLLFNFKINCRITPRTFKRGGGGESNGHPI